MSDFLPLAAGLVAACLTTFAFLPYLKSMVSGQTRPLRSTWLIWAVLSALSATANWAEGASISMLFVGVQAGFTTLIFVMSLRYGMGGFLKKADLYILLVAAIGLSLWWFSSSPIWTLGLSLSISALGGAATLSKTYKAPETESTVCWALSAVAAGFGMVSVGRFDAILLAYPTYLLVLYAGILIAIWLGRHHARKSRRDAAAILTNRPDQQPSQRGATSVIITDFDFVQDVIVIDTKGCAAGQRPRIAERADGSGIDIRLKGVLPISILGVSGISASELKVI